MSKPLHIIFIAIFLSALAAVPILTLLTQGETTSPYEFRALQAVPERSAEPDLAAYFAAWERFYTDRLFARNALIRAHVNLEWNVLRRSVVNDVFVADGRVLPVIPYEPPMAGAATDERARDAAQRVARVAGEAASYGGVFLFVGVPSQTSAFLELYPDGVFSGADNQAAANAAFFRELDALGVPYLNMAEVFPEHGGTSEYYYRADHHINLRGGLLTCAAIEAALQKAGVPIRAPAAEDLKITALPHEVLGSRGRRLYGLSPVQDEIEMFAFQTPVPFTRRDNGSPVASETLRLPEPGGFASYSVYMGGDVAETVIETNRPELPSALIYGDSYTNILETLLYPSFHEMRSLDLRAYTHMGILEYLGQYRPELVLLVRDDRSYLGTDGNGAA